ncbi:hypothetical protein EDD18DRAFT_1329557 [Armillaria luteobubalina]|uniref:Reverse transcriptase zinc-binding domain-containing protein n=1 Tax=Armillaria luteobubalina TaxID=153913 RepID=A0AA39QER6_9AGAR|nr:hypothetical protein EDD18DRAFT_1329557 [Armillaria luteobubalina]
MSSKQDIQKDRGHANSPMSPDSTSDKVLGALLSFIGSSRLSDSHGQDSHQTLGLITHVQRVPNDTSSTGTNEVPTKARYHGHNTDPKAQVPNVNVSRQPIAFNQDTMHLLMHAPEHSDFPVYMTCLDSPSEISLYTAYVPDSISPTQVYELSAEDIEQHQDIFKSPQDRGHKIDPPQEQVPMEEYASSPTNLNAMKWREVITATVMLDSVSTDRARYVCDEESHQDQERTFNKQLTDQGNLAAAFRIFTNGKMEELQAMSQSEAYKAIKVAKTRSSGKLYQKQVQRRKTRMNLERTRTATEVLTGRQPTDKLIWSGIRRKEFSNSVKLFLWMTMHDAYKVGSWWENIPGYEQRGSRAKCNQTETMEHILFECEEHS